MELGEALEKARGGDQAAMGELYRAFAPPVLAYLTTQVRRREDAEDLLGEVFVSAVRDLGSFEGDPGGFKAWLYRIATNRAIDHARRTQRRPEEPLSIADDHVDPSDAAGEALARVERARVRAAVMALPEEQRRVMVLRVVGDLSAPEIAEIVGKRVGAVKALQHRALANLARTLGDLGNPAHIPQSGKDA